MTKPRLPPKNKPVTYAGMDLEQTGNMRHHTTAACTGGHCPFHNPSEHGMTDWPMGLRSSGLIERFCEHQIGHPDPDSAAFIAAGYGHTDDTWLNHGCDGCCAKQVGFCDVCGNKITTAVGDGPQPSPLFCKQHKEG